MICLAANTATSVLSIALVKEGGQVLDLYETPETREQGNLLLHHAGRMLKAQGLSYQDIGLFAACTGPGSFTGIRIGLAALRGLALAADKPVVGVSSFDMFLPPPLAGHADLVAVESWREELYFRLTDQTGCEIFAPVNESPAVFTARLATLDIKVRLSGDAAGKMAAFLPQAVMAPSPPGNAVNIALRAQRDTAQNKKPAPFYLRDADVTVKA